MPTRAALVQALALGTLAAACSSPDGTRDAAAPADASPDVAATDAIDDAPAAMDAAPMDDAPAAMDAVAVDDTPSPPDDAATDARAPRDATARDAASSGLDWHPGHYVLVHSGSTSTRDMYLTGAVARPFAGLEIEYEWDQCEGAMGDYTPGFRLIDADLAAAEAAGKHVILFLQYKNFGADPSSVPSPVPAYLRGAGPWCTTPTSGSSTPVCGQFEMNNGVTAMIWNAGVAARMHAWFAALGAYYGPGGAGAAHGATIAGIVLPETACGDNSPVTLASVGYTPDDYVAAIEGNLAALADAFPTRPVFQYINFLPRAPNQSMALDAIARWALGHRYVGLGCPDTGDPSMFNPPGYSVLLDPAYQGHLPYNVAVESPDYDMRTSGLMDTITSATAPAPRGMAASFVVWAPVHGTGHLFTIDDVSAYIASHPDTNTAPPTY